MRRNEWRGIKKTASEEAVKSREETPHWRHGNAARKLMTRAGIKVNQHSLFCI
jgi:hypothetical protein